MIKSWLLITTSTTSAKKAGRKMSAQATVTWEFVYHQFIMINSLKIMHYLKKMAQSQFT